MEKSRNTRLLVIISLLVIIVGLSVGFAALSNVLIIKSGASFKLNGDTFDVVFSSSPEGVNLNSVNPEVSGEGVQASAATIDNSGVNPVISGLNVKFVGPGQKVTYTFYAANTGGVDAYLNSIMYKNSSDQNSPKKCSAISGTDESQVQAACNGITVTLKTGTVTTKGSMGLISDSPIPSKTNRKIEVIIDYDIEAMRPNGDFSVEFGDIELVYGEAQSS